MGGGSAKPRLRYAGISLTARPARGTLPAPSRAQPALVIIIIIITVGNNQNVAIIASAHNRNVALDLLDSLSQGRPRALPGPTDDIAHVPCPHQSTRGRAQRITRRRGGGGRAQTVRCERGDEAGADGAPKLRGRAPGQSHAHVGADPAFGDGEGAAARAEAAKLGDCGLNELAGRDPPNPS